LIEKTVTIYEVSERLPEAGTMILADTGGEWYILMYESGAAGLEWENGSREGEQEFVRWAYLGDLSKLEAESKL
jgi:hypothetical protein